MTLESPIYAARPIGSTHMSAGNERLMSAATAAFRSRK